MTTPPYGETDPLSPVPPLTEPDVATAGTPIANGLSQETGSDPETSGGSAKETAQQAASSAAEHGAHVAGTAKDEAAKVAAEAKEKATDLLADVKSQVDEQSKTQLSNLAAKLGELADEIETLVSGSETQGTVTDVAQQLADRTHRLSSHLDSREPMDLLEDVRGFARRRPAAFLAGAAVAGVVAGRLTRGAKASHDDTGTGSGSGISTPATAYDPPTTFDTPATYDTPTTYDSPSTYGATTTDATFGQADDVPLGQNTGGRQ
jgi:hypothetical protein